MKSIINNKISGRNVIETGLLFIFLIGILAFSIEGKAALRAPGVTEVEGPYILSFYLGNNGELNNFEATLTAGETEDSMILNFQVAVLSTNVTVHAKTNYTDGNLTLRASDMTITNSGLSGITISLGHKDSSGNVSAVETITGNWNGTGFLFDADDCIIIKVALLGTTLVASSITMTKVEEELPECRYLGSLPGNGAVVEKLEQVLTFWHTISDKVVVVLNPVPLKDQEGRLVSTGRLINTSDTTNLITFDPVITEPGNYSLVIPEGMVTTKTGEPLNSEATLHFTIVDKNFIPAIDAIPDTYSLSFTIEPNGTLSSIPTSIDKGEEPGEVIVNFPIELAGQQCNLAVPSKYENGRLTVQHNESDLVPSPLGNLAIGFYNWMDGHAFYEPVNEIYADWNGNGFTFNPDNMIIVKGEDGTLFLKADFIVLTKDSDTEFKCQNVIFDYDGRYLTLSSLGLCDAIYYSMDPDIAPINGVEYTGAFDIGGLNHISAVAVKDRYQPSDISDFSPVEYGIDGEAWILEKGTLQRAFLWVSKNDQTKGWPELKIHGFVDQQSYGYIEYLERLRHLDLSDAVSPVIPDQALKSTNLISIRLPKGIESIGNKAFFNSLSLSSVEWNTESDVTEQEGAVLNETLQEGAVLNETLGGRGVLFYIDGYDCPANMAGLHIIKDGRSLNPILLDDSNPWFALREFTASDISFVKSFSKKTPIDGCGGWETIALPFDVQTISYNTEKLYPFGSASGNDMSKRFWLYRTDGNWQLSDNVLKNVPYLIAMPNNEAYYQPYNIVGDVKFSASETVIDPTVEYEGDNFGSGLRFYPNYSFVNEGGVQLVVNDEDFEGNIPGSIFVAGLRDAKPFEAYMAGSSVQQIKIMDSSSVNDMLGVYGVRIWSENSQISIISPFDCKFQIFDILGRLIEEAEVDKDIRFNSSTLSEGIYIVGGRKVFIKY